jgi:hypothetical protein
VFSVFLWEKVKKRTSCVEDKPWEAGVVGLPS